MTATYSGIDGYVRNTALIRLRRLFELANPGRKSNPVKS